MPEQFKPKPFGDHDIDVKITACGVCGSDVHTATGGWGNKNWPLVPGHEIVGHVVKVGAKVTNAQVGDRVGVGAQIYSCLDCQECKSDNETYCKHQMGESSSALHMCCLGCGITKGERRADEHFLADTYGSTYPDGTLAHGGYSSHIRAHEHWFVFLFLVMCTSFMHICIHYRLTLATQGSSPSPRRSRPSSLRPCSVRA